MLQSIAAMQQTPINGNIWVNILLGSNSTTNAWMGIEATGWLIMAIIGLSLFATGFWMGRRFAARKLAKEADDREQVLELIQELGTWTSEYSGHVSQYQEELGKLSRNVSRSGSNQPRIAETSARIVSLLQQFMQNNGQLQQKLDAAETQLDQTTQQIECYLTEARTDALTGLHNRRAFDQRLEEVFHRYRAGGAPFVVALIDVDHFKSINDTHGHQAGDDALQQIAKFLGERLKDADMVARFGGEEFAVIMECPLAEAAQLLDAIRRDLDTYGLGVNGVQLNNTISAGLSQPSDDTGAAPVLRRADEALYAAKNFGRNRVYYHDDRGPALFGSPKTVSN